MADISVTAGSVLRVDGEVETRAAGGTITAGQPVRLSSGAVVATDDGTVADAAAVGVALNGGSTGQPIQYIKSGGVVAIGGTVAIGKVYVVSESGGIAPVDDIAGDEIVTVIGVGITTANIKLGIIQSGVAAAGGVS